jgi:hypothetical protein
MWKADELFTCFENRVSPRPVSVPGWGIFGSSSVERIYDEIERLAPKGDDRGRANDLQDGPVNWPAQLCPLSSSSAFLANASAED